MHSPLPRAHPSQLSVPLLMPPSRFCAGCRHCVGYHTRRRSPPAGPSTDRGRGSNPRGGTTAWSHPRRREVPHGADGGRSTTSSAGRRYSHPPAPLAPCISHPQPPERIPSPGMFTPSRHHLTLCSACSLVGAGPVSRRLLAPDADADADANGVDDGSVDGSDGGDGREDAATHATPPLPSTPTPPADADADSARPSRCCRRPPPRPHLSPPPAASLRRAPPSASTFTNAATQPTPHRPVATDPSCAPLSLSWFSLCLVCVARTVECRRGACLCVPLAATGI